MNTQNTVFFFSSDTKFIYYYPSLVAANKRETEYGNKSTALERTERADTELDIIFLVFSCSSCMRLLAGSVFTASWWMWDPLVELNQKWMPKFSTHHHLLCPSDIFFSLFYPQSPLTAFPFEFLWTNQSLPAYLLLKHFYL